MIDLEKYQNRHRELGTREFVFEREPSWCGTEPTWAFLFPPEGLFYYGPRGWFYENKVDPFYHLRIFLDDGPRPLSATMLLLLLKERLPEMPDALRAIGIAGVVKLDMLLTAELG